MNVSPIVLLFIAGATGLVGILFLLFPNWISRLEDRLNTPWGAQELTALRIGLCGEQAAEQLINRTILDRKITWDSWAKQHPRPVGAVLCLVAAVLWWQM